MTNDLRLYNIVWHCAVFGADLKPWRMANNEMSDFVPIVFSGRLIYVIWIYLDVTF